MAEHFLIEKRGLYYRPNAQGYTGLKREAGRYTYEDAAARVYPNGPRGPRDGLGMWREEDAPEFSSACAWDVKLVEKTRQEALEEAAGVIEALLPEHGAGEPQDKTDRLIDSVRREDARAIRALRSPAAAFDEPVRKSRRA